MATKIRKKLKISKFDATDFLHSDADVICFLQACIEEADDDPSVIAEALGVTARARGGIAKVAKAAGLTREGLHKALSRGGNPRWPRFSK